MGCGGVCGFQRQERELPRGFLADDCAELLSEVFSLKEAPLEVRR